MGCLFYVHVVIAGEIAEGERVGDISGITDTHLSYVPHNHAVLASPGALFIA